MAAATDAKHAVPPTGKPTTTNETGKQPPSKPLDQLRQLMAPIRAAHAAIEAKITAEYIRRSKSNGCPMHIYIDYSTKTAYTGVLYRSTDVVAEQLAAEYAADPAVKFEVDDRPAIDWSNPTRPIAEDAYPAGSSIAKPAANKPSDKPPSTAIETDESPAVLVMKLQQVYDELYKLRSAKQASAAGQTIVPIRWHMSFGFHAKIFCRYDSKDVVAKRMADEFGGRFGFEFEAFDYPATDRTTKPTADAKSAKTTIDETAAVEANAAKFHALMAPVWKPLEILKRQIKQQYSDRSTAACQNGTIDFGFDPFGETLLRVYYRSDDDVAKQLAADYEADARVRFQIDEQSAY